jgi:hypothetical protein
MNRFTPWKYIVIAVARDWRATRSRIFRKSRPADSSTKAKIDAALLGTIEDTLKAADIESRRLARSRTGIKVRLRTVTSN